MKMYIYNNSIIRNFSVLTEKSVAGLSLPQLYYKQYLIPSNDNVYKERRHE